MRKLLLGLVALAFLASALPAEAGFNLRQNDDGTTEWVREIPGSAQQTHSVGSRTLNVYIPDVSTSSTYGVVVPLTYAEVTYIQHVLLGDITGPDATYTFFIGQASDGTVLRQITGDAIAGESTGQVVVSWADAASENYVVDTLTPSVDNQVEKNQTILIHTDGGSTGTAAGHFTITVQPR